MKTKYFLFIGMIISFLLSACSSKDSGMTHFAYQETENGKWGIMSVKGKVVIPPTFQDMPTPVTDDMFFVAREDGTYELHNINEPEKIVGTNYINVTNFSEGIAFVTRKGESISCIDKNGNTLYQLPQYIKRVSIPTEGIFYAVNDKDKGGYINMQGKIIIPFQYDAGSPFVNGYAVALKYKEKSAIVIDKNGNKITSINADTKESTFDAILSNYIMLEIGVYNDIVPYAADGNFGLKNIHEKALLPANSQYKAISRSCGGYCVYQTSNGYGIMNDSGKILIKDKYSVIGSCNTNNNGMFIASIDDKWGILSMDERQLCPFEYDYIESLLNSPYFIGIKEQTSFLITKTGEIKRQFKQAFFTIDDIVESDILY